MQALLLCIGFLLGNILTVGLKQATWQQCFQRTWFESIGVAAYCWVIYG